MRILGGILWLGLAAFAAGRVYETKVPGAHVSAVVVFIVLMVVFAVALAVTRRGEGLAEK